MKPLFQAFGATMGALVDEAKRSHDDQGARLAAAWALTVMIRIHPFMDGNGRTARAAMNLTLAKAGQATIDFPVDSERVYKQSVVWQRLKDHMRVFTGERGVGWSMNEGIVPPSGYFDRAPVGRRDPRHHARQLGCAPGHRRRRGRARAGARARLRLRAADNAGGGASRGATRRPPP